MYSYYIIMRGKKSSGEQFLTLWVFGSIDVLFEYYTVVLINKLAVYFVKIGVVYTLKSKIPACL